MSRITGCYPVDDSLRSSRPIGCGEGEAIVGTTVEWVQLLDIEKPSRI